MLDEAPFEDIGGEETHFRLPKRKWRELLFIGALVAVEEPGGIFYVRDSARPLPPFRKGDLFPMGARFEVREEDGWIYVTRV